MLYCAFVCVCVCVCVYVYMCVCVRTRTYVCVCVYIYRLKPVQGVKIFALFEDAEEISNPWYQNSPKFSNVSTLVHLLWKKIIQSTFAE
jgi:hypothetical protein